MTKRLMAGLILGCLIAAPALAADLPFRAPGLWQSRADVTGPDGQPLPNAENVVTLSCVDARDDQKFFTSEQSACSGLKITGKGVAYQIDGTCNGPNGALAIHESLIYANPKNVSLQAVYSGANGKMVVSAHLQWQGPCLAGMQPGDEGNITNGAFSKTDNINDPANQ